MSNARYIEIDSTYRDRTLWPDPANFQVLISQSGRNFTSVTAVDPVSNSAPIFAWTSNRFNASGAGSDILSGTVSLTNAGVDAIGTPQTFIINTTGSTPQELENYYIGAVVVDTTTGERHRIIADIFLGTGGGKGDLEVTVDSAFSTLTNGDTVHIVDPTEIAITLDGTTFANPQIFVPNGSFNDNSYVGYVLYNETRNEWRTITTYDGVTHLLNVDTTKSTVDTTSQGPVTTWLATDSYSIRQQPPLLFTNGGGATTTTVVLTGGSSVDNFYVNNFLRVQAGTVAGNEYSYTIYPTAASGVAPVGQIRRIVSYNGTTKVATLYPALTAAPANDMNFEILLFSQDNVNPFVYTGSMVSQQEMVCYEIELMNLVLPNRTLTVGRGGRIAFYPYVYVELSNVSGAGAGILNSIYSNNPNATRMTFRAAIDDIQNPLISPFIKIDGDGMVQTLKFKPNDNLRFSVRLPDGEIFKTDLPETFSPGAPNPFVQISALFGIKRL